jgi:hypothetical protein
MIVVIPYGWIVVPLTIKFLNNLNQINKFYEFNK